MSKLASDLIRQISGSAVGPSSDLRAQLGELRARFGTVTAASKALGIDRRTFQRWESGAIRQPRPQHAQTIDRTIREARVKAADTPKSELKVTFRFDSRDRTLTDKNLKLTPGTVESMRTAYVSGDREGVARAFLDGVTEPWYRGRLDEAYDDDVRGEENHDAGEGSDSVGAFV